MKNKDQVGKKAHKSLCVFLGFISGSAFGTAFSMSALYLYLCIALFFILLFLWRHHRVQLGLLFGISFFLGAAYLTHHILQVSRQPLYTFSNRAIHLQGRICDAPDLRSGYVNLPVCVQLLQHQPSHGTILVRTHKFTDWQYGDILTAQGIIEIPFEDEHFSYKNYLLKDGITHTMRNPSLQLLKREPPSLDPYPHLLALRGWFEERINSLWSEPYASFLAGLLIGSRKGIPQEVLDNFQRTGLTHIIAISGYNITLLIVIITTFLGFLPKRTQILTSIFTIIGFTLLVGASSAVVRASIMGILGLLALFTYHRSVSILSILCTACLMILHKPFIVLYDVGFQLSFLAVLGLMYVSPLLEHWTQRIPPILGIKESLLLTISATVTTTPIMLYHFGSFSFTSPVANVLVAPFLPLAMFFGFMSILTNLVLGFFAFPLQWITARCLQIVIWVADSCARIPGGYFSDYHITLFGTVVLYILLCIFLFGFYRYKKHISSGKTSLVE